ncbi:unnamed protein product, partial [Rotaria socialis]
KGSIFCIQQFYYHPPPYPPPNPRPNPPPNPP